MRTGRSLQAVFTMVVALAMAVGHEGIAGQKPKSPKNNNTAASTAQTAAANARQNLADAKGKAADLNKAVTDAKDAVKEAADALKKLETEIEDAQSADSAFGKARDAFRAAEKQLAAARAEVLESAEYKEKYEQAKAADDTAALASLRKDTLENSANVQESLGKFKEAKGTYEPLRTPLFKDDEKWTAANEDLQGKKKSLKDAEDDLHKAIAKERQAVADAKKAAADSIAKANADAAAKANQQRQQQLQQQQQQQRRR